MTDFMKTIKYFLGICVLATLAACGGTVEPPVTPPTPGGGGSGNDTTEYAGAGTKADPYTVADVIKMNPTSTSSTNFPGVWVEGYVVGFYDNKSNPSVLSTTPDSICVNVMIAAEATGATLSNTVCVQLPAGAIRTALDIYTNSSLVGKEIMVFGDIMKYNGIPGVKNTTGYWLVAENTGVEPQTFEGLFYESFASSQGDFTIDNVTLPSNLTYIWNHDIYGTNGYMKGSAFSGGNNAAESWLVSPIINMSTLSSATLSFQHTNYKGGDDSEFFFVKISEGDAGEWETLTIPTWPTVKWGFVSSGNIDITKYAGKSVRIAFVYTSTASYAGTWEVKDVLIK